MSISLTVTAKGQITLRREVLDHLGLRPGDRVEVDLLAPGLVELRRPGSGTIADVFGAVPSNGVSLSVEEMNEVIGRGWSSQ